MLNLRSTAWMIFIVMGAVIVGAWIFEMIGYAPCDLCLMQRWAYYAVVPLSLLLALLNPPWIKQGLWLCFLILVGSMVFGIYHAGIEWKFWDGPGTCGAGALTGGLPDLSKPAVKCDEAALRILGISLAGWNAIISGALAVVTFLKLRQAAQGSSSVSQ